MKTSMSSHCFSYLAIALALLVATPFFHPLFAQTDIFLADSPVFTGLWLSDADWGDFDQDGDLDIIMVGYGLAGATGDGFMRLYRNDGNSIFTEVVTGMPGVGNGSVRFADLDGDGDLDVILCGQNVSNVDITKVFINTDGVFTDSGAILPSRVSSSIDVGDYDNDGDLDILITGGTIANVSDGYTTIYRNDGEFQFTAMDLGLIGVRNGHAAFGDYDSDSRLDIAITGRAESGIYITKIYHGNADGTFTDIGAALAGLRYSRLAWLDYNCDGMLDFMVSGSWSNENPSEFHLYRNDGANVFTEITHTIPGERQGDVSWGDVNNDGFPDILINGLITNTTTVSNLYLYNPTNGAFEAAQEMTYLKYACQRFGDYNNDGKLDLNLSGRYDYQDYWNLLYMNTTAIANTAPSSPSNPDADVVGNDVTLFWDPATDAQTPAAGLTYNLRVGTVPGGNDIISAMADADSGWRIIARPGNNWQNSYKWLTGLADGTYYWSVQAIDNAFAGSAFAPEQSFNIGIVSSDDPLVSPLASVSNYPNPFSTRTNIRLDIRVAGMTRVDVYNLKGQLVCRLANDMFSPGIHTLNWDGKDLSGREAASGIYLLKVFGSNQITTHRLLMLK